MYFVRLIFAQLQALAMLSENILTSKYSRFIIMVINFVPMSNSRSILLIMVTVAKIDTIGNSWNFNLCHSHGDPKNESKIHYNIIGKISTTQLLHYLIHNHFGNIHCKLFATVVIPKCIKLQQKYNIRVVNESLLMVISSLYLISQLLHNRFTTVVFNNTDNAFATTQHLGQNTTVANGTIFVVPCCESIVIRPNSQQITRNLQQLCCEDFFL